MTTQQQMADHVEKIAAQFKLVVREEMGEPGTEQKPCGCRQSRVW